MNAANHSTDHALVIERTFKAPRQLVWDVWTQPEHIANWWGPKGYYTRVEEYDFRPGGKWKYVMVGTNGQEHAVVGIFETILEPEKIVTTDNFGEGHEAVGVAEMPGILKLIVELEDLGEHTRLTLTQTHTTEAEKEKHRAMGVMQGWASSFEKIDEYLIQFQTK